jgi:hypothetical protein
MPRLRLRLGTLLILIVMIALAAALLVQQRRESALQARLRVVEDEKEWSRLSFRRQENFRQKQLNELRSQVTRQAGAGQDPSPNQPIRRGEPEREKADDHRR